jgi:hypothetical protein
MKSDRCLDSLRKIMDIEGIDRESGNLARRHALEDWINTWVADVTITQPIIKKQFTSDEMDFLKDHSAKKVVEALMEDCVSINLTNNKLRVKIRSLKRK